MALEHSKNLDLESGRNECKSWSEWVSRPADYCPNLILTYASFNFLYLSNCCLLFKGSTMAKMPETREIKCGLDNAKIPFLPLHKCECPVFPPWQEVVACLVHRTLLPPPILWDRCQDPLSISHSLSPSLVNDKKPGKERALDKSSFPLAYQGVYMDPPFLGNWTPTNFEGPSNLWSLQFLGKNK